MKPVTSRIPIGTNRKGLFPASCNLIPDLIVARRGRKTGRRKAGLARFNLCSVAEKKIEKSVTDEALVFQVNQK